MGIGFAVTWLRQVSPPPASQNHFIQWSEVAELHVGSVSETTIGINTELQRHFFAVLIPTLL